MCQHTICRIINVVFGRMLVECRDCGRRFDKPVPPNGI